MKPFFKANLTHFIAVAIFLLCSIIYCKPALEGKVLQQSDISQWKGMAQETLTAGIKYGQNPLWTNSMFGGMPTYQITGVPGFTYTIGLLDRILNSCSKISPDKSLPSSSILLKIISLKWPEDQLHNGIQHKTL